MLLIYGEKGKKTYNLSLQTTWIIHGPVSLRKSVSSLHSKSISIRLRKNWGVAFHCPITAIDCKLIPAERTRLTNQQTKKHSCTCASKLAGSTVLHRQKLPFPFSPISFTHEIVKTFWQHGLEHMAGTIRRLNHNLTIIY